ncbi:MAG: phosphatase PAP2 family protein [Alphaproteobacteria bacterium]|nr:phosphatase PAP2 family protein [Alphaproteobacteria bacterium]
MKRLCSCLAAALLLAAFPARADTTETAGTAVAIALPLTAAGIAISKRDWNGVVDLGLTTIATVGTAYALKHLVKEKRPDGSDFQSFPSDTQALASSGSAFLWARYGWQYGLPAFAASAFVGYSRVEAKKHHWYDTAASSAIAIGYAAFFTPRFSKYRIYSSLDTSPDGAMLRLSYAY